MPLKRHASLQPLSREHHFGLQLCYKLQQASAKNVAIGRIKAYLDYAWQYHLAPHFAVEEAVVFPILRDGHPMVQRALADHERLKNLFAEKATAHHTLHEIEEVLKDHIRFEERVLFEEVQSVADAKQYAEILKVHAELNRNVTGCPRWEDEFWK